MMPTDPPHLAPPPAGEAHVWYTRQDRISDPELLAKYLGLLCAEERRRQARFVFERDRHRFLVAHALVRTTLSRYADVDPAAWTFRAGEHGKPDIATPEFARSLRFNMSDTGGMVLVGVVGGCEIGVDVEDARRELADVDIADRFFSASEADELRSLPPEQQQRRFFDYWTLKESYIKARGMGLALPLGRFSFHLDAAPIRISFAPTLDDNPAIWQFAQFHPTEHHKIAIALRRGSEPDLHIVLRETVPLADR